MKRPGSSRMPPARVMSSARMMSLLPAPPPGRAPAVPDPAHAAVGVLGLGRAAERIGERRDDGPPVGMRVHVSYRPEDVMISVPDAGLETSARNQYALRIFALHESGGLVRLRLDGAVQLNALITRASAEHLGLKAGMEVIAHMKATALRALRSA